jgi:hypothetical protein
MPPDAPSPPVPTGLDAAERPAVRIVWDRGRISEWYEALRQVPRSTLTQSFGYAQAMLTVARWKPRLGLILLGERTVGLVVAMERRVLGIRQVRIDRGPLLRPEAARPAVLALALKAIRQEYPGGLLRPLTLLPELAAGPDAAAVLRWAGFRPRTDPGYRTLWLNLAPAEAALRAALHPTWRNKLRQAEAAGLEVEVDRAGALLPWLLDRYAEDKAARGYPGPSPALVTRMRTGMHKDGDVLVLRALADGVPVAGVLMFGHGQAATYQIGWSGADGRRRRAHNLLLWRAALELKAAGRLWLDLGGINDTAPGVTRFKRGMGGEEIELCGSWR